MTTRRPTRGFTSSLNKFIKAASWLGPLDAPAIAALKAICKELDTAEVMTPAMLAQHGLAYRSLLKRQPSEEPAEDEFERLLAEGQS